MLRREVHIGGMWRSNVQLRACREERVCWCGYVDGGKDSKCGYLEEGDAYMGVWRIWKQAWGWKRGM